ncbi:MAG: shikimate dehydrogenase family protein [Anaerotardibacter sp.]
MANMVSATTKLVGLIGSPVNASLSPTMHNTVFSLKEEDAIYCAFDVTEATVEKALKGLGALGAKGCNVTVPLKQCVCQYLDEIDISAQLMQSVNTVCFINGRSVGYNTDGLSFTKTLADAEISLPESTIAIADIGAEGPAYIVQAAVEGAQEIAVFTSSENVEKAASFYKTISQKTKCPITVYDISDKDAVIKHVAQAQVFCNATRIGAEPKIDESPLPSQALHEKLLVLDTIYNPRETKLLRQARECGSQTIGGLTLLLNQAALAEKLWFDIEMPTEEIKKLLF